MLRRVELIRVAPSPDLALLDQLAAGLARLLGVSCHVRSDSIDGMSAFDPLRGQVNSTSVLATLAAMDGDAGTVLLGVTDGDLYVPILTFVFGEAQMPGRVALVSLCRLRNEFYGVPADPELLRLRLLKEAMHEIGHTQGLKHCDDWRCVMVRSHAVEKLDVKSDNFCELCATTARIRRISSRGIV